MDENAFEREPGTARVSQNYVKAALASLMPVVLETLSKQDEDSADDLEHWDLGEYLSVVVLVVVGRGGVGDGGGEEEEEGGAYFFIACLSHSTIDHAYPSRRSTNGEGEGGGGDGGGVVVVLW